MTRDTVGSLTRSLNEADAEVAAAQKAHDDLAAKRAHQVEHGETLEIRTASRLALESAAAKVAITTRRRAETAARAALAKAEAKPLAKADAAADALAATEAKAVDTLAAAIEAVRPALASVQKAAEVARAALGDIKPDTRALLGAYQPTSDLDGLADAPVVAILRRYIRVLENRERAASMANNSATTPNAGRPWPAQFNFTSNPAERR